MLFSVIIPTLDRRGLLRETLDSVMSQTFTDFETIVVDDGSVDGTREWLAAHQSGLRILTTDHAGPGGARNAAAKVARGEYLAFLDSDDLWFPWTLSVYEKVIDTQRFPSFVVGTPRIFKDPIELAEERADAPLVEKFSDYLDSSDQWRWYGTSSFVVRRQTFLEVRGFIDKGINSEDADLALKLGEARAFVHVKSPKVFGYRTHSQSLVSQSTRTLKGLHHILASEKAGHYPGGDQRARQRWKIITRHARPVAMTCARNGQLGEALRIYASTLRYHLALRKWRFLCGFPFACLGALAGGDRFIARGDA